MGVSTALGDSPEALADALRKGESGVRPIQHMDTRGLDVSHAGEVAGFEPHDFPPRDEERIDRATRLALYAASQAVESAGLGDGTVDAERAGIAVGMAGSIQHDNLPVTLDGDVNTEKRTSLYFARAVPRVQTAYLANRLGLNGPQITFSVASVATGMALEQATNLLRSGRADVVLVGGGETLTIINATGMASLGITAQGPATPFSGDPGIAFGEAGAFIVLESLKHARERGASIEAEVRSSRSASDGYDAISNDPSGAGLHRAMRRALDDAGVDRDDVDWIKASGTGNRGQDLLETAAIKELYADADAIPPASSLESAYGHVLGVSPILGFIGATKAQQNGFIPPTAHFDTETERSGCDLDYVPNEAREADVERFLVNGIAFGGNNSAIVGSRVEPDADARARAVAQPPPEVDDIVLTGCGVVSPIGHGMDAFVDGLRAGTSGIGDVDRFDVSDNVATQAGLVTDFEPRRLAPSQTTRRLSPMATYGVTATALAFKNADLKSGIIDSESLGVLAGLSRGSVHTQERMFNILFSGRRGAMLGKQMLEMGRFSIATRVADNFNVEGYAGSIDQGLTGGLHALAYGAEHLRQHQDLDALIVLSADAICELFFDLYDALGVLATESFRPYGALDPSLNGRAESGMALGEGAVAFILERRDAALARDASPLAQVSGWALGTEGTAPLQPRPDAAGMRRVLTDALADAGTDEAPLSPDDVDCVYGHGRGAAAYDSVEAQALRDIFAQRDSVPTGSVLGHTGVAEATSGLYSVAAAAASIQHDEVYPLCTTGALPDAPPLDFATEVRSRAVDRALVTGGTENGANAAVLLEAA